MMNTYSYEITVEVSDTLPPLPMVFTIGKKKGDVYFKQRRVVNQLLDGLMWIQVIIARDMVSGGDWGNQDAR